MRVPLALTLSRPARDGKAVAGPVEPAPPEPDLQSELFAKVVLALMLGEHAGNYLDVQRAAHLQRMRELTEFKRQAGTLDVLLADHALYCLEAELRWIDHTAARLRERDCERGWHARTGR